MQPPSLKLRAVKNGKCVPIRMIFVSLNVIFDTMVTARELRNKLIDSLMAIDDQDYLKALQKMIQSSNVEHIKIPLTEAQKLMLMMSDDDIKNKRVIDQETLAQRELEWLSKE